MFTPAWWSRRCRWTSSNLTCLRTWRTTWAGTRKTNPFRRPTPKPETWQQTKAVANWFCEEHLALKINVGKHSEKTRRKNEWSKEYDKIFGNSRLDLIIWNRDRFLTLCIHQQIGGCDLKFKNKSAPTVNIVNDLKIVFDSLLALTSVQPNSIHSHFSPLLDTIYFNWEAWVYWIWQQ